jgi:hypothetical protein
VVAVTAPAWKPGSAARLARYDPATGQPLPGEAAYPALVTGNDGEFVSAVFDAGSGPGTGGPLYFDQDGLWLAAPGRWRLLPARPGGGDATEEEADGNG